MPSFLAGLFDGPGRPSKKNGIGTWRIPIFAEAAGADSIDAVLVFLHLLERHAERVGKLGLAHAQHEAAHAHAIADVLVGRVSWFSHGRSKAECGD